MLNHFHLNLNISSHMNQSSFSPMYEISHYISKKKVILSDSVVIWLPSGVGPNKHHRKYILRFVDDYYMLKASILWPACFQKFTMETTKPYVTTVQNKITKRAINLQDEDIVGFEDGLSNDGVSTVHVTETRRLIRLGFACMTDFNKQNLGWSKCGSMKDLCPPSI